MFTGWKIKRIIKKIKSMQHYRIHNQPKDELLKREILYYFELATVYKKLKHNKKYPYAELMMIECYRVAASLDDASAHFQLGQLFLEEGKFRQNLDQQGVFNSQANFKRAQELFEAAIIHFEAAEKLGHSIAKRMRGVCFINGWGVAENKNAGLELIVASIEQEGSWDKVPQIFASIGLNKPEFFAAIMQKRME